MQGEGTLVHSWSDCKLVQRIWISVWKILKKLKVSLPCDPATTLLVISPKDLTSYPMTLARLCSQPLRSQWLGDRNNPNALQRMDNDENVVHVIEHP